MATTTTNYGLTKPATTDNYDVGVFNGNADTIDAAIKARADEINQRAYTTLACTKSSTVYALTGLTATSGRVPVLFAADSAYAAGDTVTIDGTAYALATRDGSALTAGAWAAGKVITGIADVDNKVLTVEPSAPVGSRSATWMPNATDVGALAWKGILNNPDLNTVLTPGSYYIQGCTNGPAQFGFLDVKQGYTSAYLLQVFYDISTHCMFTRKYQNSTFETSWALLSGGFLILNKSDSIPTGLADNTIVLRKQS